VALRDTLQKYRGVVVVVVLCLVVYAVWTSINSLRSGAPAIPTQNYYSVDDGKTYFADDNELFAPFDKGGKTAVRAFVFSCSGKKFVGYLSRYTPSAKKIMDQHMKEVRADRNKPPSTLGVIMGASSDLEYKAPGEQEWVSKHEPAVKCPDGSKPERIDP
jgi:hypothetical protein